MRQNQPQSREPTREAFSPQKNPLKTPDVVNETRLNSLKTPDVVNEAGHNKALQNYRTNLV